MFKQHQMLRIGTFLHTLQNCKIIIMYIYIIIILQETHLTAWRTDEEKPCRFWGFNVPAECETKQEQQNPKQNKTQHLNVLPLNPVVGHNKPCMLHSTPGISSLSPFLPPWSTHLYQILSLTVFCVGFPSKIGHPAHSSKLFKQVPLISAYVI